MSASLKNFLPGPTMVRQETLRCLSQPIIGHRTPEFRELMARINPRLQTLFGTQFPVFCLTGSASGAMEAALANAAGDRVLIVSNGLFGERWRDAARSLGLDAVSLRFEWGHPVDLEAVERSFKYKNIKSLVMVHGETSTGMLNALEPLAELLRKYEDILIIVDAVATIGGVPLEMDRLGIDVLVGASQKCLALPPGVVPIGVSGRALERSRKSRRKGYAADFNLWKERWQVCEVVATPALPQFYALDYQLNRIESETLPRRCERHKRMLQMTTRWAKEQGWAHFGAMTALLPSVSCLLPPNKTDILRIVEYMRQRGFLIDGGHGQLSGQAVRIGHMGDWTEGELAELLSALSQAN